MELKVKRDSWLTVSCPLRGSNTPMSSYEDAPITRWVKGHSLFANSEQQYECLDSNQVKAANLAERTYKIPLTTKSHSHKSCFKATYKTYRWS